MRKRKERTERSVNLISKENEEHEIGKEEKGFFACYLLCSLSPRHKGHTYIGFTINPRRRIRQHNGEIRCGAWRTKTKRPWEMLLCIYGFPTTVSALQFEWAWQHPTESLAVRKAAASLKSLSGIANKIKLAYTMLTLPAWQSLNLTVNFFSTKYTKHSAGCPSLPEQMKVQVCSMEELPCYTECGQTLYENEDDENGDSENDDENGHLKEGLTDLSVYNVAEYNYSFEKIAHEQSGWIEDDGFRQPREPLAPIEDRKLSSCPVDPLIRTPSSRDLFGLIEESICEMGQSIKQKLLTPKATDNYQPPSTNVLLSPEVEVINLLSPDCLIRSCHKKKRASSVCPMIIDLTKSPVFIQL